MLHVGLDLSRRRLDYLALANDGTEVEAGAAPPDADGLRGLAARLARHGEPISAVIESMTGARFVHDTLELHGWDVEVADAQRVKGLAPLARKTDRIDARVLAELSRLDLVPAIWLPDPEVRAERERARFRLFLVRQRARLKQLVHSTLMAWGTPCRSRRRSCSRAPRRSGDGDEQWDVGVIGADPPQLDIDRGDLVVEVVDINAATQTRVTVHHLRAICRIKGARRTRPRG